MNNTFGTLVHFIKEMNIANNLILTRETSLSKDLGIYGDDIEVFFYKFSRKFNIDLSSFNSMKYFETDWFTSFVYFIKQKKIYVRDLTLSDLEEAIIKGKLE